VSKLYAINVIMSI